MVYPMTGQVSLKLDFYFVLHLIASHGISGVVKLDPWLSPFKDSLRSRYSHAQKWIRTLDETEGGLEKFSRGREKYGFNIQQNGDIIYREWAPNATRAYLIGDFSKWFCQS